MFTDNMTMGGHANMNMKKCSLGISFKTKARDCLEVTCK